jgi:hypothetical protein
MPKLDCEVDKENNENTPGWEKPIDNDNCDPWR